jgi:hypothetical protein
LKNHKKEITHISIKYIDKSTKSVFGVAHHISWLDMTDEGTINATATDDREFKQLCFLCAKGVNMFDVAENNILIK